VFKFPPQMLEDEIDEMVKRFKQRLSNEGWELDTYLKVNDKEEATLREEFKDSAESRIRRGLAIMEIANRESIVVLEKDVQQEVQRTVDFVTGTFDPRESRKILTEDFLRGLVSGAVRDAVTERTMARIAAIARGEAETEPESAAEPEILEAASTDTPEPVEAEPGPEGEAEPEMPEAATSDTPEPFEAVEGNSPAEEN
jgi:FKBP-type peptidyl-prolyl cis-trans isomerase (trigger factor)